MVDHAVAEGGCVDRARIWLESSESSVMTCACVYDVVPDGQTQPVEEAALFHAQPAALSQRPSPRQAPLAL